MKNVCVIGLGYIGLPTLAFLADNGFKVNGVDINKSIVDSINNGIGNCLEPQIDDIIKVGVANGQISATLTPQCSDIYVIVVPTPTHKDNKPDISYVKAAVTTLAPLLKDDDLLIIESTSPVGTTDTMLDIISKERSDLIKSKSGDNSVELKVHLAYCPERVLPGNIIHELVYNARVIGGATPEAAKQAEDFYSTFVKGELYLTNARTAEMCKLIENASRDLQIAFANELSIICDKNDIDAWELIELANKHPRVNILNPGCGVGGHCIAVDPWFIISKYPLESRIMKMAREINNYKPFWCAEKIINVVQEFELEHGRAPSLALMGLAYKPNIDDLRESPAKYIVSEVIQHLGDNASCYIVEPNISKHNIFNLSEYKMAYEKSDIVAFLVPHEQFKTLEHSDEKIILDFCGITKL